MKILNGLVGVALVLGVSIYAVSMYSTYIEKPFLSYKNLPFPVTSEAFPGDKIEFTVVRCNSSKEVKPLVSTRALVPEDVTMRTIVFDFVFVNVAPGCSPPIKLPVTIPHGTDPGFYRYVGRSALRGLISEHEVSWNTELILVKESPE